MESVQEVQSQKTEWEKSVIKKVGFAPLRKPFFGKIKKGKMTALSSKAETWRGPWQICGRDGSLKLHDTRAMGRDVAIVARQTRGRPISSQTLRPTRWLVIEWGVRLYWLGEPNRCATSHKCKVASTNEPPCTGHRSLIMPTIGFKIDYCVAHAMVSVQKAKPQVSCDCEKQCFSTMQCRNVRITNCTWIQLT